MDTQTTKIRESVVSNDSRSSINSKELIELAKKLNYSSLRFMVAPDKAISEEAVIEDTLFLLKNIDTPTDAVKETFSTKGR